MKIVFASHSTFNPYLVVGSHHLAHALTVKGHDVWHIGPPLTPFHFLMAFKNEYRERVIHAFQSPRKLGNLLTSTDPMTLVPWQIAKRGLSFGNLFISSSNVTRMMRDLSKGEPIDALLVDDPRFVGLEKLLKPKSLFYRATDLYAEMKKDPLLLKAERLILSRCDGVIATSQPVLHHLLTLKPGLPSLLLENGVDHRHFSQPGVEPEEIRHIPHPRVIYVGALDFRFSHTVVAFLARQMRDVHFIVIGLGKLLPEMQQMHEPNLHVLGPKTYASIPAYLQFSDVGLLPLVANAANSGRSPMKLYEYGAAGLPVVASRTPELFRRQDNFVHLFDSPEEGVTCLKNILIAPVDRHKISESCQDYSWTNKTSILENFMKEATAADGFIPT